MMSDIEGVAARTKGEVGTNGAGVGGGVMESLLVVFSGGVLGVAGDESPSGRRLLLAPLATVELLGGRNLRVDGVDGTSMVTLEGAGRLTVKLGTSSSNVTDWTEPESDNNRSILEF